MRLRTAVLTVAVLPFALSADRVQAQDFLFGTPIAQLTVRSGPALYRANGDLYDFMTKELTLERGDFKAMSLGGELSIIARPQMDFVIGVSYAEMRSKSEFRDWLDNNDLPIEQTTSLRTTPVTVSLKFYPLPRGESISKLAWVPARFTPYVGGGAGVTFYQLRLQGDFIDMDDLSVFPDDYESGGRGNTAHLMAGTDYWMTGQFGFNIDARYSFGSAPLRDDFLAYDRLDVSGFQAGVGITYRW